MDWGLLQEHTVNIYGLKTKHFTIYKVPARSLLNASRFDLYAKLFYISNRAEDPELARGVYINHILAFNPDGKEPGRTDKCGVEDFINFFDRLIDYFKDNEFDETISLVPVGSGNVILDGAHRVAALAYYNKEISIIQFHDVTPKCSFDYNYFLKRGMSWRIADIVALESLNWMNNVYVACLWPRITTEEKRRVKTVIMDTYHIIYSRSFPISLKSLSKFVTYVYRNQDWIGNEENGYWGAYNKALLCYGPSKTVQFIFFEGSNLSEILLMKEKIRGIFPYNKHSLHISDALEETKEIGKLILLEKGLSLWLASNREGSLLHLKEQIREKKELFCNVTLINWKVRVYRFLKRKY